MNTLLSYLNTIHPLSEKLKEHLASVLKKETFSKKSFLLQAGEICSHIYFVEKGLVRCYYQKEAGDISTWFMKEGDVIISVESFFLQKPGYEYIQALEDTVVYGISYSELQVIYKTFPEFNTIGRMLTEKYYLLSERRLYSLRMMRAQERYQFMMEDSPELVQRVPSAYLASYLSITKETLSRIRGKKIRKPVI